MDHDAEAPTLPTRFPCLVRAIYSWGGETKRDLGFVEGDLIECLNAGDGRWWMGRLRRNKTVGLFPSNFVELLPDVVPAPSRAVSPMPGGAGGSISRSGTPNPHDRSRAASPQPSMRGYYPDGAGSSRSRTGKSPSPNQYHRAASPNPYTRTASPAPPPHRAVSPNPYQRAVSPNPYQRAASPNPYQRVASPAPSHHIQRAVSPAPSQFRAKSPAPSQFRAKSPAPSMMQQQQYRAPSPNPYMNDMPPPAPPPHRYGSPMPPPHQDGRLTPIHNSRPPSGIGRTPSPLRSAMDDVMESLQLMTGSESGKPATPAPVDPWSPQAFGEVYSPAPRRQIMRPETSLGFAAARRSYEEQEPEMGGSYNSRQPAPGNTYVDQMEERLRRFQLSQQDMERQVSNNQRNPDYRKSCYAEIQHFDHLQENTNRGVRGRKSAYDIRAQTSSPTKMFRPRPLSRMETVTTNASSNNSATTTRTTSTAATSASIMSGVSASALSATSAGSLARHKKALSMATFSGFSGRDSPQLAPSYNSRSETPSGFLGSVAGNSMGNPLRPRGKTWGAADATDSDTGSGIFGGLATPASKPKKTGFFKKIINSAKTSAASARSVAGSSNSAPVQQPYIPKAIPDGITAIAGGSHRSMLAAQQPQDWVQVRRDVNRANTLSRNERIERQEKQQMMDQLVLRPVDALDEDVDGDEAADGNIVEDPQDFSAAANLTLVDKAARFIVSVPPLTSPETLALHHVCRPYKSAVQQLRAVFTWCAEKLAWEHPSGPIADGTYGHPEEIDTRRILSSRRGSPEEIAVVVAGMCAALQIPCNIIHGYLKTPGEPADLDGLPRPNHFWNAILCEGEWRFMDCSLASPTHPKRAMYSSAPVNQADPFYFLTKPSHLCWTHVPLSAPQDQHLVPPLPISILLALPTACPPFFHHGIQMMNFDTSLTRLEDLEVAQVELIVPRDVECIAEVEAKSFAVDQDGDVFETGDTIKKRALAQAFWENGLKVYRVKAVLPSDEGAAVLKIYAGRRGLMHSIRDNPHPLTLSLPISHAGENPPYSFVLRHPTPHAQRHDLYILQPQCSRLAINNTFVFAVRQGAADFGQNTGGGKPAKLGIQTPSGKILRLMRKSDGKGNTGEGGNGGGDYGVWETIIKCTERGPWRGLVLADRSARWCVYAEWVVV
ncbi:hypothetical protein EX30DRAFT_308803 [Ascodesmis nigricans]|uniref:SH3 domain-containing protein n=1 Tax=Ascodesmis nigricans TaxID=341454 RepID=A0A4S2MQQ7_9PEZI|nr:hypothetical protein EX30DRAFT_308803 [Ascodesmis nigricans]